MNLMIGNIWVVSLKSTLSIRKILQNLHNDYPLAPERAKIGNVEKLIQNVNNKTNFVMHYENLKLFENLGLKITKIDRGIKFQESVGWNNALV